MLTLSSISQRIEQLEEETYHDEDDRLNTWFNMCKWQYFIFIHGDSWHDVFEKLPKDDEIKKVYNSLFWFPIWKFTDVLPATGDGWLSEKVQISLGAWLSVAFEEGYTPESLFCREALDDCLSFVSNALTNGDYWTKFHEQKRKEYEFWELQQKYRRMANFGELSEEAIEWLKTYDSAFLENFNAKKQSEVKPVEVKPVRVEAITPVLPEIKPETTKPTSEYVTAHWAGLDENWLTRTVDGVLPVFRNRLYKFSAEIWGNIQGDNYLKARWHEVE